jgi:hypothetical protein
MASFALADVLRNAEAFPLPQVIAHPVVEHKHRFDLSREP